MRTLALAVTAAVLLVACAGGSTPTPSSAPAASAASPKAVAATAASTPATAATPALPTAYVPQAGQAGVASASEDLTFSGSITGTMTKGAVPSAFCGPLTVNSGTGSPSSKGINVPITGTVGGATYVFGILISGQAKDTGTFTTTDYWTSFAGSSANGNIIAVTVSTPDNALNLTSLAGGTVSVDAGGQSGTVSVTIDDRSPMLSKPATKTVKVSGKWSCR